MFGTLPIRRGIHQGEFFVGCFSNMASAMSVHIAAHSGYDFVVLDHEHSPADFHDAVACMNAAQGSDAEIWVRVPMNDQAYIKRILDCGTSGIMCPMVNTVEDARRLVSYCTFPPTGVRGIAPNLCRHTDYGVRREEYMSRVLPQITVMAQIETKEGLANIDGIAAVEGISLLFIGPFDLSADLGYPGQFDHPVVTAAIERIETAAKAANKALATLLLPGQDAAALRARGYRLIIAGSDVGLLRSAFSDQLKTFAKVKAMPVPV
jgi:2-keto-3-deoxy-L-rhamnonate aldolase RhmA